MKKARIFILFIIILFIFFSCTGKNIQKANAEYNKGRTLYAHKELEKSIDYFDRAIKYNKKFKQPYLMKAKAYYYLNKPEEAKNVCEQVLKRYPDYVDANLLMGKILFYREEYTKAIPFFNQVLDMDSTHIEARLILGHIYRIKKEYDQALVSYADVSYSLDFIALSYIKQAEVYFELGNEAKALEYLEFITKNSNLVNKEVLNTAYELLIKIKSSHDAKLKNSYQNQDNGE